MRKYFWSVSGVVLLLASFLTLACSNQAIVPEQTNRAPGQQNPGAGQTAANPAPAHADHDAEDAMPRINVDDAKKQVDEGKAVIIDVRGTDSYKVAHIKGALDIPLNRLESGDYRGMPKDKRIIAYCT